MIPIMVAEAMTTTKWQPRLNSIFIIPQPDFILKKSFLPSGLVTTAFQLLNSFIHLHNKY